MIHDRDGELSMMSVKKICLEWHIFSEEPYNPMNIPSQGRVYDCTWKQHQTFCGQRK